MTALHTKHGFPIVRQLDLSRSSQGGTTGSSQRDSRFKKRKAKSLFLKQFEEKELEYFGIEVAPGIAGRMSRECDKDVVEPISVEPDIKNEEKRMECDDQLGTEESERESPALLEDW